MKRAIVILQYNRENDSLTRNLITNIKEKISGSFDIIVADDGSPYFKDFPSDVKVIRHENFGYTRNHNHALKSLPGYDLYWVINNDIEILNDALFFLEEDFKKHPDLGITCPTFNSPFLHIEGSPLKRLCRIGFKKLRYVPYIEGTAWCFRKEVLSKIGLLDESSTKIGWGTDLDYCYRTREAGYLIAVDDRAKIKHLISTTHKAMFGANFGEQARPEMEQLLVPKYGHNYWQKLSNPSMRQLRKNFGRYLLSQF